MVIFLVFVYNEENNIIPTLEKIRHVMEKRGSDYKVFIVDDGSTDRTVERIKQLRNQMSIEIIRNNTNMGVAFSFKKGMENIRLSCPLPNDAVIVWEGDNTMDPQLIEALIAKWRDGAEVVCSSRYIAGGRNYRFFSGRYLLSGIANFIFKALFPIKEVNDYTHFARLYRWDILEKASLYYGDRFIEADDFAFNAEILLKIRRLGIKFVQVPSHFQYDKRRGKSKLNIRKRGIDFLKLIARTRCT